MNSYLERLQIRSGGFIARAFILIAAFGQFGGNRSECPEEATMSLIGPSGEE
ncbi:MAG TPA: hypothetical protein VN939_09790 [Chthoniobacterales bacterium]|nr:hypothetical protein [Chthoniobacterales bacterium]